MRKFEKIALIIAGVILVVFVTCMSIYSYRLDHPSDDTKAIDNTKVVELVDTVAVDTVCAK